jgi:hypothetical protein
MSHVFRTAVPLDDVLDTPLPHQYQQQQNQVSSGLTPPPSPTQTAPAGSDSAENAAQPTAWTGYFAAPDGRFERDAATLIFNSGSSSPSSSSVVAAATAEEASLGAAAAQDNSPFTPEEVAPLASDGDDALLLAEGEELNSLSPDAGAGASFSPSGSQVVALDEDIEGSGEYEIAAGIVGASADSGEDGDAASVAQLPGQTSGTAGDHLSASDGQIPGASDAVADGTFEKMRAERDDARNENEALQREIDELRAEKEEIVRHAHAFVDAERADLSWQAQHYVQSVVQHRNALVAQLEHSFERLGEAKQENATLKNTVRQRDDTVSTLQKDHASAEEKSSEYVVTINKLTREARDEAMIASRVKELLERAVRLLDGTCVAQLAFGDSRAQQVAGPFWAPTAPPRPGQLSGKAGMLLRQRVVSARRNPDGTPTESSPVGRPVMWKRCFVVVRGCMLLRYSLVSTTSGNSQSSRTSVQPRLLKAVVHLHGGRLLSAEIVAPSGSGSPSRESGGELPPPELARSGSGSKLDASVAMATPSGGYPFSITVRADAFAPNPKKRAPAPRELHLDSPLEDAGAADIPGAAPATAEGAASGLSDSDAEVDSSRPVTLVFSAGTDQERQEWLAALRSDVSWVAAYERNRQ